MGKLDLSAYKGREQAYIKHYLLEEYLSSWTYKIGSSWDSMVYIDGFAGPWGATDENYSDASFGIAVRILNDSIGVLRRKGNNSVRAAAIFIEKKPTSFDKLKAFAERRSNADVTALALKGRFIDQVALLQTHIAQAGRNPFKFLFLDQKGWAAAPILQMKPVLAGRSSEVLFNLMTSFLTRFVEHESTASSYHHLFGREGVLELIRSLPKGTGEREEAAVREYCISLSTICGFRYVSQAVILEPEKEKVRYYMIFATHHPKGIEVFKDAEIKAAKIQDSIRHEAKVVKTGQTEMLFDEGPPPSSIVADTRKRMLKKGKATVMDLLSKTGDSGIPFAELFCAAMAFPLVAPSDLHGWLIEFSDLIEIQLESPGSRRRPSASSNDRILLTNRDGLLALRASD